MTKISFVRLGNDDDDMIPHAIFWRPVLYFASSVRKESDDLDRFDAASYCIGNEFSFSIRHYNRHLPSTSSLYFSIEIDDDDEIDEWIGLIIRTLRVPYAAIGWRRGQDFIPGLLKRPPHDRLRESEARMIILKIAAKRPDHTATTTFIKRAFQEYYPLSEFDKTPSRTRRNEQLWQQIVGNVISHRDSSAGPFATGMATRTPDGLTVSKKGLDYLNSIGFSV